MDHVDIVSLCNGNDFINGEISLDWRILSPLADNVCLVRLCQVVSAEQLGSRNGEM